MPYPPRTLLRKVLLRLKIRPDLEFLKYVLRASGLLRLEAGLQKCQVFAVVVCQVRVDEQVGAVAEGFCQSLVAAPAADFGVVAAGEDLGNLVAAEVGGAGVVGVVEKAAGSVSGGRDGAGGVGVAEVGGAEAFVAGGIGVAEGAGQEANDGVDDDGGGELTA